MVIIHALEQYRSRVRRIDNLAYQELAAKGGLEPPTTALTGRRSTIELLGN